MGAIYFYVTPTKALRFQSCKYENNNPGSGADQLSEADGSLGAEPTLRRFLQFFSKK